MAAGSISEREFTELVLKLAEVSALISDTWRVVHSSRSAGGVYLERKSIVIDTTADQVSRSQYLDIENDTSLAEQADDPSCLTLSGEKTHSFLNYEHHIVYSPSYAVPVLYFNVYKPNGHRLELEELWNRVPKEHHIRMLEHKWATLTQQEHPVLGSPYFTLHPCHTATLMSQVPQADNKRYYLIKWLSSVGPVAGLELSPEYATIFDVIDSV
ncbi:hypothetical protein C0Q70_16506 [Pomacea canaliculata]|uniref:Ubiquitin-like-conjugating enzyme ATG10 n=2 Tax=Pomacea canaliculata TaxID=400727 RepID=A0A2T7NQ17_POMCA|nr:hypothetical protein C0Q70_16506 [Pomacea canaliculata]